MTSAELAALRGRVSVADGAWSTALRSRGMPPDVPAETANLTHPGLVLTLGREYVAAGARFLSTNTFSANRFALSRRAPGADVAALNREGARLAREAAGTGGVAVAGCMGPSGCILAVREVSEAELAEGLREQAEALAAGGVDVLLLETFSELAEMVLAIRVVREATGLPVIASMSFDSGPQRTHTLMGVAAERGAAAMEEAGAEVVGCNCGAGIAHVLPAVVALRAHTGRPLWVKPSAGPPELVEGAPVYRQTPEQFAAHVPALIEAGAEIIGGCCGTGPEHIRRVAGLVHRRERGAQRSGRADRSGGQG
jgi:methionine synthase I (cobalamin-dependent)